MNRASARLSALLLLLFCVGVFASPIEANSPNSQVAAESQGIAVAISNWTPFMVNTTTTSPDANGGVVGPGFPFSILPYQNTGTGVYLRGGIASEQWVSMPYRIENDGAFSLTFALYFEATTDWDVKAAASDVLHAVKKKATGDAKKSLKKSAEDSGEDALEAAGAADGMTEVYVTLKVIEDIAKLFKALDPTYKMVFGFAEGDNPNQIPFYDNTCITMNQNTPGPANVILVGPDETITSENTDDFFVVAAGSVNQTDPGFVDISVSPLCDYVCAAWNATLDYLNEYPQSDCVDATSGSTGDTNYAAFSEQNSCLVLSGDGPGSVAWVSPPSGQFARLVPPDGCYATVIDSYGPVPSSICGACPEVSTGPAGSWSESCNEVSLTDDTLCANCANDASSDRINYSCSTCSTEVWGNSDGALTCDTSPPPGSWAQTCIMNSYNGTEQNLCASCENDYGDYVSSCQTCTSLTWTNENGQLTCAASSQTASREPPALLRAPMPDFSPVRYASNPGPYVAEPTQGANR